MTYAPYGIVVTTIRASGDCYLQCPPLNRITLGQHKSDNNYRMIQLTDEFYVLLWYKWDNNF